MRTRGTFLNSSPLTKRVARILGWVLFLILPLQGMNLVLIDIRGPAHYHAPMAALADGNPALHDHSGVEHHHHSADESPILVDDDNHHHDALALEDRTSGSVSSAVFAPMVPTDHLCTLAGLSQPPPTTRSSSTPDSPSSRIERPPSTIRL
jgi:hypothetical protein